MRLLSAILASLALWAFIIIGVSGLVFKVLRPYFGGGA